MKDLIIALAFIMMGMFSCQRTNDTYITSAPFEVNDSLIMKYVTCSAQMINTLIAKGDSIYAQTSTYSLENIGFKNDYYNKHLVKIYGDTIPIVVSIFDTYDVLTCYNEDDEVNASFVWHEVAKMQIIRFLERGGKDVTVEDIDKTFKVLEEILDYYGSGTQYDMNVAAARGIMGADYHLLEAYKHIMDCFPTSEIRALVHEDYKYILDTLRNYIGERYERDSYSDLPRVLSCMYKNILMAKTASIDELIKNNANEQSVIKDLCEHTCFEAGKFFTLSNDMLDEYSSNFE